MLKAVIFDFDGVIADSEPVHYQALNEIFKRYGVEISQQEHWDKYLGYTDQDNIEAVSRDYDLGITDEDMPGLIADKAFIFERIIRQSECLIDGVADFIGRLREGGVRMAICSGALLNDIEVMLEGSGLRDCFEVIVTADDTTRGKPDPEGYLMALNRLNRNGTEQVAGRDCVVIEDSRWGLEAARAAGMRTVGVTTTYSREELGGLCDLVVGSLGGLSLEQIRVLCV